ncbi:MAG: hydroxymethylbilane synthase [Flavipsychrobacter sp.]|nr:hydroxymethylbilane synthase [Flavipsychrobacter sp.]
MIQKVIRIGTRESQLAVWQATRVQELLKGFGYSSELIYIKSEGDTDLKTPLYEIGVQGIFTRALDIALLNGDIDIAVHSMKDVPTVMAAGIVQAAVLPRASYTDILVPGPGYTEADGVPRVIATSSVRRKAQWLHRYPADSLENLRGNVNTRLRKVAESNWHGAIFAAAGLERIGLRPENAISLDWMLPAPAQGAIVVVCKAGDDHCLEACGLLNDEDTELCTHIERQFLRTLMGGCTTPISALACVADGLVLFEGSILSVDGKEKMAVNKSVLLSEAKGLGNVAGEELLAMGASRLLAK